MSFGRKKVDSSRDLANAMRDTVREQRAADPLIGAKLVSTMILEFVSKDLRNERGTHAETLLATLGALAGYACVAAVEERTRRRGLTPEQAGVVVMRGKDGRVYWFGDVMNEMLLQRGTSVGQMTIAMGRTLGLDPSFDALDIVSHVASTVGTAEFGVPRLPPGHPAALSPFDAVRIFWPRLRPEILTLCDEPEDWPIAFAIAIQQVQRQSTALFDAETAVRIVAEYACPMGKIAPESIGFR